MNEPITLTAQELDLLKRIAMSDGTDERRALHDAIFIFASKVDYTLNVLSTGKIVG